PAVGAHRQRAADLGLRRSAADAHRDDLARHVRIAQPERLLDRDLVERIGPVVDAFGDDPRVVGLHLDLRLVILDPLDRDKNLQDFPPFAGRSPRTSQCDTSEAVFFRPPLRPDTSHPRASSSSAPKMALFTVAGEMPSASSPRSCPSLTTSAIRSTY